MSPMIKKRKGMNGLRKLDDDGAWRRKGEKDNSPTPQLLFESLNKEFGFNFDPCPINSEGMRSADGFGGDWGTRTYVNPPWSKTGKWVREAIRQHKEGRLVVMFTPANISTKWFCEEVWGTASEVRIVYPKFTPGSTVVLVFDPSHPNRGSPAIRIWNPREVEP